MAIDSQCDLAAVVYRSDDDPDRLLADFAGDLCRAGRRVVGAVQIGRDCRSDAPRLGVVVLPGGDVTGLVEPAPTCGCRIDPGRLGGLAAGLVRAIEDGADVVIINRFGRLEADGAGLIDVMRQALDAEIPVLTAVHERRFGDWIAFTGGMNVRLGCRRDALDRWWRSVGGAAARRRIGAVTFCEFAK